MALESEQNLLHYRLVEKIGEGGMGVVWKAVDTTLDREVAIKILPDQFAQDTERLARFEREAKLLASLNHPNIAAVFGLHESDLTRFLAMELVAGEDLSERLSRGAMTVESALRTAMSVAEALEAAHENGVIHRDLKPANIRQALDDRVKVLDFGLAKAFDAVSGESSDPSLSPTMTSAGTMAGMILGTASYMSPEQAAGQPTDKRCDIWAFGVVLCEMLTGQRLFEGETVSHTLADVLRADIDLDRLPTGVPRSIRRLLARCLDRNPKRRLRDIGEARVVIEDALAGAGEDDSGETEPPLAAVPPPGKRAVAWSVAAVATVIALISLAMLLMPERVAPERVGHFTVTSPNSGNLRQGDGLAIAISRDGRMIVTRGGSGNDDVLYLRAIDDFVPRVIVGTSGARLPFFSPDGKWLAFVTSRGFWKVNLTGGAPISVGAFGAAPFGASWSSDGNIYFSSAGEIWKIPATGGEAQSIAVFERDEGRRLTNPHVLPSGRALLLNTNNAPGRPGRLMALDLETREFKDLNIQGANPRYLPTGHMLFLQADQVLAVGFDEQSLEPTGTPIAVLDRVWTESGIMQLDVADDGTVAYLPRRPGETQKLVLVDRLGITEPLVTATLPFPSCSDPRLSPDGRRLVVSDANGAIWMIDLETQTPTLLSESGFYPLWSPDGAIVTFTTPRNKSFDLYRVNADLSQPEFLLLDQEHNLRSADWTRDGTLVFREEIPGKGMDLWYWPDEEEGSIESLMAGPDDELAPAVSPDGRWVAYVSDQSGRDEIYVTSFPRPTGRVQASDSGGTSPAWSPDGKELFYVEGNQLIAVRLHLSANLRVVGREVLFTGNYVQYRWQRQYDVHPDGDHFVMLENPPRGDVEVITHWFSELESQVAALD